MNDDANSSEAEVDNRHQADRQADLKFLTRRRISALFVTTVIILAIIVLAFLSTASKDPRQACVSPAVRREWRQLNNTEKKTYIDAVKCLQTFPSQLTGIGRRSDDFPWLHRHIAKSSESYFRTRLTVSDSTQSTIRQCSYHIIDISSTYTRSLCASSATTLAS